MTLAMLLMMAIVSNTAQAQELNEIVNNHIQAVGGADNWKKINSMVINMSMKAQGADIKLTMSRLHKKGMRIDIDAMGMQGYQIMTDKAGWTFMPFQGQTKPEPVTEEDVKSSQSDLDIMDEFMTYKEYGKTIEYLGKDEIEGTECFKISMTAKDGKVSTYYLDASNYYVVKQVTKQTVNGKEMESVLTFGDYKKLDAGIVMPMSQGGSMGNMEMSSVVVNTGIDESLFQPKLLSELKK